MSIQNTKKCHDFSRSEFNPHYTAFSPFLICTRKAGLATPTPFGPFFRKFIYFAKDKRPQKEVYIHILVILNKFHSYSCYIFYSFKLCFIFFSFIQGCDLHKLLAPSFSFEFSHCCLGIHSDTL